MTDDIRVDSGSPIDLLIAGGLTVDVIGGVEVSGGAARYATEAALDAGYRVALHVVGGPELVARETVERLMRQAEVVWQEAPTSIVFEHHGEHDRRRLRLRSGTDDLKIPDPDHIHSARAVLFAPVAGEVPAGTLAQLTASVRAAGLQGWLRAADADGWVTHPTLHDVDPALAEALRGLDLLLASSDDLGGSVGPSALARLRAWIGPGPELVATAGADGAWLDSGQRPIEHIPAHAVTDRSTIGAGDAFAALLTAGRGSGLGLAAAARAASEGTAHYLATRSSG